MEKVFSTKSRKRLDRIYLPYRKGVRYIRNARVRKRTRPIKRGSRTTKQRSRTEGSERVGQRNKEAVQRGARESDNETKKPYRGEQESRTTKQRNRTAKQRETNNETKKAGQESEGVEHPLTFGSYINNQIGK